jgi:hypothetical protein
MTIFRAVVQELCAPIELAEVHIGYEICMAENIPFQVVGMDFPDKDRAMLWVLKNQLGRRNLNNYQFGLLVGQEYELEKKLSRGGGDRRSEEAIENQRRQNDANDSQRTVSASLSITSHPKQSSVPPTSS